MTRLIFRVQEGDEYAAAKLWEHFSSRLVRAVRNRISRSARRVSDEDDIVNCAFEHCFRAIREARYPDLRDRHSLWGFLLSVSERRLVNLNRDHSRQKRGGGNVRGESVFFRPDNPGRRGIEDVAGADPPPEIIVAVAEQSARLLDCLDDVKRQIALLKLAGYTDNDIGKELRISESTVVRKLALIRSAWQKVDDDAIDIG
ncbi:MAG: hypothetical protein KDA89_09875 [Planctomycetaceae bacterium]|nr:hypothetical protein [Planctomycetaceae bacterium]